MGEEDRRDHERCVRECIVRLGKWLCSCQGPSELLSQGAGKLGYLTPKSHLFFNPYAEMHVGTLGVF